MTLNAHSFLSLVGGSVDSLTGSVLGSVLHLLSLLSGSVGSILGSILYSITGSTDG